MSRLLRRISIVNVATGLAALALVLFGVGLLTREDVADKPYLKIAGSGFIFNYRVADVYYGFTAFVQKPVKNYSVIEATFEDPSGGSPHQVRVKMSPRSSRYGVRSPPLRGVEAHHPYRVSVRLIQNGDGAVLFEDAFTVTSQISDRIVPPQPLTVGPGYTRNPQMPDGWTAPAASDPRLDHAG
ncbi:hypothetical protein E3C22_11520 [Jiella endophytica]|uniref:Uncharacterized protein n=1 Tax=Jiella endophytica TaxID=2558362 RepID=A0A4Y8RJ51_9HYPH|nr:hypothetical protein [Jiella endophytica]TFF23065.1 hypothetical protein E3C22_11520 [Jiella endophytica]